MGPLHVIIIILLGLFGPCMAVAPRQMLGKDDGKTDIAVDGDHIPGEEVSGQDIIPRALEGMLLTYDIKCDTHPDTETPPGFLPGKLLSKKFCSDWWGCKNDGTKYKKKEPDPNWARQTKSNIQWCKDHCDCEVVDKPARHGNWNYGCVNPYGGAVHGS